MGNSRAVKAFVSEMYAKDKSLAERFVNVVKKFVAKITQWFENFSKQESQTMEAKLMRDAGEEFQKLWDDAFKEAIKGYQVLYTEESAFTDGDKVLYSERYLSAEENIDILSMIKQVENKNFKANDKVYLGKVSDKIANQLLNLTGIDVKGFKMAVEARQIEHILKDHGKKGLSDQSMANDSDVAKMGYVLKNPDDIRHSGKTQAYTYMSNGRNRTADTVLYEKSIGIKSYYVVQAVPDTKAKTLYIVTAFIGKKGYKKEASQLINASSLDVTAKTGSAETSTNKISQNSEIVNSKISEDEKVKESLREDEKKAGIKLLSEDDLPNYLHAGTRTNKYKQDAINSGKKIILTSLAEIKDYINKAIAGEKGLPTAAYGMVDVKLSDATADYSDGKIKIKNYYLELVADDIRHSYQEHLYAKEKGDIDLSTEDFINIPLYIATYDDFVYAIKYKSGNTKICVSKKIGGGRVLIIETVSKSHGSVEFKNLIGISEEKYIEEYEKIYKKRNSTNTRGSKSSNNSLRDETVSNTSINENESFVNRNTQKNFSDREPAKTGAEILSNIFNSNPKYEGYEKDAQNLVKYQLEMQKKERNLKRLAEIDEEINLLKSRRAQSGKGTRMYQLYQMRHTSEQRIAEAEKRMLEYESQQLKRVIEQERRKADEELKKRYTGERREAVSEVRTRYARKEFIASISKKARDLQDKLLKNTKDKHIPEDFKKPIADFLATLDFTPPNILNHKGEVTRKAQNAALAYENLKSWIDKHAGEYVEGIGYLDIDSGLSDALEEQREKMTEAIKSLGDTQVFQIYDMGNAELETLKKTLNAILHAVNKANTLISDANSALIDATAKSIIEHMEALKQKKPLGRFAEPVANFAMWENTLPIYAFDRLGESGKKLFESFQNGFDTLVRDVERIDSFTDGVYTSQEVKDWSKEVHTFECRTLLGKKRELHLTTPQIMSFYCLSRRDHAIPHFKGGGIVAEDIKIGNQVYSNDARGVRLTDEIINEIIGTLTERQREVAEKLQDFLNTECSAWGNEISLKRHGFRMYTERYYWPIIPKSSTHDKKSVETKYNTEMYAILNMSQNKPLTAFANNQIVIGDIFDVFADHTSSMARYHSLALPIIDFMKVYNYREKVYADSDTSLVSSEDSEDKKITADMSDGERYLEHQLYNNAQTVIKMDAVASLTGKEFEANGKETLKDRVVAFFNSFNNSVVNNELGEISVTLSSFRDDKAHGLTYNKVVSFAAVPDVIKHGKVIDVWKPDGKPYQRITLAAPISISGEKYYMGVMIQKDNQSQRMYLHDVIAEKATLSFTTEPTTNDGEGIRDKSHLFITSILQKALNVNRDFSDFSDEDTSFEQLNVRDAMENAFGKGGVKYFEDFITTVSGSNWTQDSATILMSLTKNAKLAMVGFNLRTASQQPTSAVRAVMYLGLDDNPKKRVK